MTFALVEITQVGYTVVPFSLVQLVQEWSYRIGGTIATYVSIRPAIFLHPNNGDFNAVQVR